MLPNWKKNIILKIKQEIINGKTLSFIHIPKCGGCFASQYMDLCNINNKGHNIADNENEITFAIIRDPIKRFESLLNYRLGGEKQRLDFPKNLRYVYFDKSISLNEIVDQFTYDDIIKLYPYKNYTYWCQNIDLLITIEELEETLTILGFNVENIIFEQKNVSIKERGTFNELSIKKISDFYKEDIELYNFWTKKD
jgi:hypothetical protein